MTSSLVANNRTDFGKGAARRMRREGQIPAVVYGHGSEPIHVSFDSHEFTLTLRKRESSIEIVIDGKTHIVAPRDIQIDPVRRGVEHVDLILITAAEATRIAQEAADTQARNDAGAAAAIAAAEAKASARAARIASGEEQAAASVENTETNSAE